MVFECPVCSNPPFRRSELGKVNQHILARKEDPAHAPHADSLLRCEVCRKKLKTPQARSKHKLTCRNAAISSSAQPPQQLSVGRPHTSFRQFVHLFPPAATLLLALFCTLDIDDIPEIIFCRLRNDRACWGSDGEIENTAVPVAIPLADLLTNRQFEDTVQFLISSELIESGSGALGKRKFTIKPGVRDHVRAASRDQELLEWYCLVLICHAFPGRREEIGFGDSARVLMPQIRHVFSHCQSLLDQIVRCPDIGYVITLTLLLSSYVSDRQWKLWALELVGRILSCGPQFGNRTLYLQKLRTQRARDISCRLPNMSIESLCEEQPPIDPRTNALHGEHLRSNAQEILMNKTMTITGSLDNAYQESSKFRYFTTVPSEMEKIEKYQHDFFDGKIYRWKAQFRKASDTFDRLYHSDYFKFDDNGCNIIGHLVGALCEQGKLDVAELVARQVVMDLEQLDQQGLKRIGLMSFRLLQLSLAETLICKALVKRADGVVYNNEIVQKLKESESILQSLRDGYELSRSQRGLSWGSEINYLRVCMGRALISHLQDRLEEAYDRWAEARKHADICKKVVTIFVPMIIDYSQCDISYRLGKWREAELLLERARQTFKVVGREHWWTCYGTLLLDIFKVSIPYSGISTMHRE